MSSVNFNNCSEKGLISVLDTTLRDGEQAAGVDLRPRKKLKIALQLEKLGVDVIEAGFPASNEEDYKAVELISRKLTEPTICAFGRATKGDIEKAFESIKFARKKRIHTFLATSKIHLDSKLKKSEEQALEMIYNGISYAKSFGTEIEFTPEDGSRTEMNYLFKVIRTANDAGATIINIADTVGDSQPFRFYERVRSVYENFEEQIKSGKMKLSVHCHNDKGQAVANTLAGVLAGATQIEGTINGIGERTGNAALEEIVMNIKSDPDYFNGYTKINTVEFFKTSKMVSKLTGLVVSKNKPLVGANAFCHESGIHQHGMLNNPKTYEVFDPVIVGWEGKRFLVGKHSGKHIQEYFKSQRTGWFNYLGNLLKFGYNRSL